VATAIVPVKRFGAAKQRLLGVLDRPQRAALAKAMLADVLSALERSTLVDTVIVVTGEGRAERLALARGREGLLLEVLRDPDDAGHSQAATLGVVRAVALGAECAALLPGDCPLLDPAELDEVLDGMAQGRAVVVPDRHGSGTNALILAPPDAIAPAFGEGSRARHVERAARRGLDVLVSQLSSLALDVDEPDDLSDLSRILEQDPDAAPATAAEVARISARISGIRR